MQRVHVETGSAGPPRTSAPKAPSVAQKTGHRASATSLLTVRLPDLSSSAALPASQRKLGEDDHDQFAAALQRFSEVTEADGPEPTAAQHMLARAYRVVGQPKFWLACITAIGVQVVLGLVFTPVDKPPVAPRNPVKSLAPAPERVGAARIVVPPAETPAAGTRGATSAADLLSAPTMQPAPPADAATPWEISPSTSTAPAEGGEAAGEDHSAPRLTRRSRLADDQTYDGRDASEAAGATLEGVLPIDDVELEQPNGGSR